VSKIQGPVPSFGTGIPIGAAAGAAGCCADPAPARRSMVPEMMTQAAIRVNDVVSFMMELPTVSV
jgi:hypothetical protein